MNLQFTVLVCWGHLWRSRIGISTGMLHLSQSDKRDLIGYRGETDGRGIITIGCVKHVPTVRILDITLS